MEEYDAYGFDYDKASKRIQQLEEALQIKPDSVAVLESLAPIESMRNRTERAEDYFSRLLKIML